MSKIHTLTHPNGDKLDFIDYGPHGMTIRLTQDGEWFDFGFGPDKTPELIEWLTAAQKNTEAGK